MLTKVLTGGVLGLAVLAWWLHVPPRTALAQPAACAIDDSKWVGQFQLADKCKQCHTKPQGDHKTNGALDLVLMTEYSIWRTHDKHSQAYAVLEGSRGKSMAKLLGKDVTDPKTGCMNCHAMYSLLSDQLAGDPTKKPDGVSCGGCHGPSRKWIGPHSNPDQPKEWRLLSPEAKCQLGFRDLRDPETKATLCMSCHIGNAAEGKVVTHAMFAAGHPPLPPIEIATFSKNEPQHWRDAMDLPLAEKKPKNMSEEQYATFKKNYHLDNMEGRQTRLALIGGIVALRETMKLVRDRADLEGDLARKNPSELWPELLLNQDPAVVNDPEKLRKLAGERWPEIAMAHSDCYACHHDLKNPGYRQERGFGYLLPSGQLLRVTPGRPLARSWPVALAAVAAAYTEHPERMKLLEEELGRLVKACQAQPFGTAEDIRRAAEAIIVWCKTTMEDLEKAPYDKPALQKFLGALCKVYGTGTMSDTAKGARRILPDYEAARQIVSLLRVVYEEWHPKGSRGAGDEEIEKHLAALAQQVDLEPYTKRQARLSVILELVRKTAGGNVEGLQAAMQKFSDYLKPENIGNRTLLEQLIDNRFLDEVQRLSNEDFTKALLQPEIIDQLQAFGNAELEELLQRIANFNPQAFKNELRLLGAAIAKETK